MIIKIDWCKTQHQAEISAHFALHKIGFVKCFGHKVHVMLIILKEVSCMLAAWNHQSIRWCTLYRISIDDWGRLQSENKSMANDLASWRLNAIAMSDEVENIACSYNDLAARLTIRMVGLKM
jgi:hypothetical protein